MSSFVAGSPEGVERREYGTQSSVHTRNRSPKSTWQKYTDIFTECPSRDHLVTLLNQQVESNVSLPVPVCLALVELEPKDNLAPEYSEATMAVVSKIFRSHLRPGDQIVRYRRKTLGLILPETDAAGAQTVTRRLHQAISRKLSFGRNSVVVTPIFGTSDGHLEAEVGENLLHQAEMALEQARALSA